MSLLLDDGLHPHFAQRRFIMPQIAHAAPLSPLEGLIEDAYHHLQGAGYHPMYLRDCRSVWRTFVHFAAQEAGNDILSEHLVTQFLESRGISAKLTSELS